MQIFSSPLAIGIEAKEDEKAAVKSKTAVGNRSKPLLLIKEYHASIDDE